MEKETLGSLIIENADFVCYVADKDTYDLIYINKLTKKLLASAYGEDFEYIGKKCYKIFQNLDEPCAHCENKRLKLGEHIQRTMFVHLTQRSYILFDSLIEIDNKQQRLTIAYDNSNEYNEVQKISEQLTLESTLLKCAYALMQEKDSELALKNLLSIVGEFYHAARVYLFEIDEDKSILHKAFEWTHPIKSKKMLPVTNVLLEDFKPVLKHLETNKEYVINNIEEELDKKSNAYHTLKRLNVHSILIVPFFEKDKIQNVITVDNPGIIPENLSFLHSVSLFMNSEIKKRLFQNELEALSYIDTLTGIYNRNKYAARLEELDKIKISTLGVLHFNINNLKNINELYGEEYGDFIIKEMSNILRTYIEQDIYRLSGDEFIALCLDITKDDFDKLIEILRSIDNERKEFSFAIGGIWQDKNIDIRQAVNQSGEIMFAEKQKFYKDNSLQTVKSRSNPLSILLDEIQKGCFSIHLQPKINLETMNIIGAEALVRKKSLEGKIIPPDKFIPIYEHEGTVRHVDFFVFEEVCLLLKELISLKKPTQIAVNFSRLTFMSYDIVDEMTRICEKHTIPHEYIKIEITESIDKLDFEFFDKKLHSIKEAGFDVSLDDFGAKHSNLLMLSMVDFTEIKLDKGLIDNITTHPKNKSVVKNIIRAISELGSAQCLAEGIEIKEQMDLLLELGCQFGQGYYFYKPMDKQSFIDLCINHEIKEKPLSGISNENDTLYSDAHVKEILALLDATPLCMNLVDYRNQPSFCNKQVLKTFGLSSRDEYGELFHKLSPLRQPDGKLSSEAALAYIEQARRDGMAKFNWLHCDLEGNEIPSEIRIKRLDILDSTNQPYLATYVKDLRSEIAGIEDNDWTDGYFLDIISEKILFRSIADMASGWYFAIDLRTSNLQYFGKGREKLNLPTTKLKFPDDIKINNTIYEDDLHLLDSLNKAIRSGVDRPFELRFILPSDEVRYFRIIYKTIFDKERKPLFAIGRTYDVHEEKMLEILSQKDLLTSCYNKITAEKLIVNILQKYKNSKHAFFIFDIDNFKNINDTYGHQIGDKVLEELAKNLQAHFRDVDIIGRVGGDEFIIFLKDIDNINIIKSKAEMIALAFNKTYIGHEKNQKVSGSIGIALYPSDGKNYKELYACADKALYQSKAKGKDCFSFFSEI